MGKELQVRKFSHCLRTVFVIGKYTDIFRWEGERFMLRINFHRKNFSSRGKFPAVKFPEEISCLRDLTKFSAG